MAERTRNTNRTGAQNREVLIWEYACFLLKSRIYSEKALTDKLRRKFPNEEIAIKHVLDKLKYYKYLNDEEAIKILKDNLKRKGYGPKYIKQYLLRKGFIDREEEVEYDKSMLGKWYKKRMGNQKITDLKTWRKMYNYLSCKGFYSEDIIEFLKGWTEYEG